MKYLFLQISGQEIEVYGIAQEGMTIGRSLECAVVIPHAEVSRLHAEICFQDEKLYLKDKGSKNGTILNGRFIRLNESLPLNLEDRIQIGPAMIWISDRSSIKGNESLQAVSENPIFNTIARIIPESDLEDHKLIRILQGVQKFNEVGDTTQIEDLLKTEIRELLGADQVLLTGDIALKEMKGIRSKDVQGLETLHQPLFFIRLSEKKDYEAQSVGEHFSYKGISDLIWPILDFAAFSRQWVNIVWKKERSLCVQDFLLLSFLCYQAMLVKKKLLESRVSGRGDSSAGLFYWVGESPAMKFVEELIRRVAPTEACILLSGETGTGKEMAARMIHALSPRAQKPFVCVNCGAIPEPLLESDLFGHEKGAFTGAHQLRIGKFELASEGTLFLDEIGEMSPETQKKILRVLETKELTRVGGNTLIESKARIVAATHRNLRSEIEKGRFREDLYFRLNVVSIHIPSLKEHKEDIPFLVNHLLERIAKDLGRALPKIDLKAMDKLVAYHWPGNIRELKNVLERAMVLSEGRELNERDFLLIESNLENSTTSLFHGSWEEARHLWEREYLIKLLIKTQGNVTEASALARIARQNLHEALKRHHISADQFRGKVSSKNDK